jgi:putative FmdB family regulatory protein
MPIYEYICDDCETRFERIVINRQQEIACPKCASKKATIQLSVFATANSSANGSSSKSSPSSSGDGGGCCGGGCACH